MRALNLDFLKFVPRRAHRIPVAAAVLLAITLICGTTAEAQEPPDPETVQIVSFGATNIFDDVWAFEGYVEGGPTLGGLDVVFDDLLRGHSTTTDAIGRFYFTKDLGNEYGTASVIVFSVDGIPSNSALTDAG